MGSGAPCGDGGWGGEGDGQGEREEDAGDARGDLHRAHS